MINTRPIGEKEALSSWLIRNSISQGSDPMGWAYGIWGEWRVWTRDIDRYLSEEKAGQLKIATGLSLESIKSMTLVPLLKNIYGETPDIHKSWKWVIPTGQRNRTLTNGMPFCSECLKGTIPSFPIQWRLSWNISCSKHQTILHNKCPRCSTVFSPHLITYDKAKLHACVTCGFDLRKTISHPIDKDVAALQSLMNSLLDKASCSTTFPLCGEPIGTVEFFKLLRDLLSLPRMIQKNTEKFSQWSNIVIPGQPITAVTRKAGLTFDALSSEERHYLMKLSSVLMKMSPETFIDGLRESKVTYSMVTDKHYPSSKYLLDLFSHLSQKPKYKKVRKTLNKKIEPKSRMEVEESMNAIRRYL